MSRDKKSDSASFELAKASATGGWGAKLSPGRLEQILRGLVKHDDINVVVGTEQPDDAAIYRMPGGDLLIQTVDIISPIVNDPRKFGRIAAANSLSDVYAMGGRPFSAMNIACFPSSELPLELLGETIAGGQEALAEARCALVGGHSVKDPEFKFGFSVSGVVEGGEPLSIDRAQRGHLLLMTKPLGTGVVNQALRKNLIDDKSETYLHAQDSMCTLNAQGLTAARAAGVSACTDITGFGLLGHAAQFARASGVTFELNRSKVSVISGVRELVKKGVMAGRTKDNSEAYRNRIAGLPSDEEASLLFDPQTSGGLLVVIPEDGLDTFQGAMRDWPFECPVVGRVIEAGERDVALLDA